MTSSRRIAKPEKPRPLKLSTIGGEQSIDLVLSEMDYITQCLNSNAADRAVYSTVVSLCENLKIFGPQLELVYKDQLDRCYVSLRNGCRDDKISLPARFRLLEVIELRAMNWMSNENHAAYYKKKIPLLEIDQAMRNEQITPDPNLPNMNMSRTIPISPSINTSFNAYANNNTSTPYGGLMPPKLTNILSPGEILKSSGKFAKAARVPGKNLYKEEIVIRNVDSGKVMGLKGRRVHMIEELSETVISFQRVNPGQRERLVQITGPTEDNLRHASQLIEDTIRRNASPIRDDQNNGFTMREGSSSSVSSHASDDGFQNTSYMNNNAPNKKVTNNFDEPIGEYRYTVSHGNDTIRITGTNLTFVKIAKLVLEEHFSNEETKNELVITSDLDESIAFSLPSTSVGNSPTSERTSFSETVDGTDLPKKAVLTVIRKPLIPTSSRNDIENAENYENVLSKEARLRRNLFSKTNEGRKSPESNAGSLSPTTCSPSPKPRRITYSREFIAKCADNRSSHRTPKKWSFVVIKYPILVKQSKCNLATLVSTMHDVGESFLNDSPSYLPDDDFFTAADFLNNSYKYWNILRKSSVVEDEDN